MLFSHAFVCSLKSQQPAVTRFKVGAEFSQGADTEKQRLLRMKKMFADISSEEQSSVSFDNNKLFSCSDINTTTEIFFIFKHFFFFLVMACMFQRGKKIAIFFSYNLQSFSSFKLPVRSYLIL